MDKKNSENYGVSVHSNNLRLAEDIDIIEQSNEKLQDTVDKLHTESAYGMHINVVKTNTEEKVNIDGQAIENVKSFIYLGSEFTWDNDCSKDIQRLL